MKFSPEEKQVGRDNYYEAVAAHDRMQGREIGGETRRDFLKTVIAASAAGAVPAAGLGAMYFGYGRPGNPVRVGVIGTGDEGNVLIGAINPDYIQVVAIADIRPSSIHRAFHGDWASPGARAARKGLMAVYGWTSEDEARRHVKVSTDDYHELLANNDVEAVIIALPLHLHAKVSVEAMLAGKHVLTEKLMAHNIAQCKVMSQVAQEKSMLLATGHQRHYSILYDNAVKLIQWGLLGEIHHIRAQWHRGNLPGRDSWAQPLPGGEIPVGGTEAERVDRIVDQLNSFKRALDREKDPLKYAELQKKISQWSAWDRDKTVNADAYDYLDVTLPNGRRRSALEELVRWRLWNRTGGGLMAELGSHQLDAASIFIGSLRADGRKAHPLTVHAVGGRHIFPLDRDSDDHVYCMFEFPGPGYDPSFDPGYKDEIAHVPNPTTGIDSWEVDESKKIVVTYSSINGSGYGGYGEVVMGTKGEMALLKEQEVLLFKKSATTTNIKVSADGGGPTLDTQDSASGGPVAKAAEQSGPISRGYREQMEHWAWCIQNRAPENRPRCHPEVALADAILALTAKVAMDNASKGKGGFIAFDDKWFNYKDPATPDGSNVEEERKRLI